MIRSDSRTTRQAVPDACLPADLALSHPDRIVFPESGITKLQLAQYYEIAAARMLMHIAQRPLMVLRCPQGLGGPCFHQKHLQRGMPHSIRAGADYLLANDVQALLGLVQFGVIELHTWGARVPRLGRPDRLTLDLDPDPVLAWKSIRKAALLARGVLQDLGLGAFLKTTGGKGVHIVAPLLPRHDWAEVKRIARAIAERLALLAPDLFSATLSKTPRRGKIFVDYLRNVQGASVVAAYSVRARAHAPVCLPIYWEELASDVRFAHFNLHNAMTRLRRERDDPWVDYAAAARQITSRMHRLLAAGAK